MESVPAESSRESESLKKTSVIIRAAALAALGTCATARAQYEVPDPAYNAPGGWYSTATGTGVTLKNNLNELIDHNTVSSYDNARFALQVLDADPVIRDTVLTPRTPLVPGSIGR